MPAGFPAHAVPTDNLEMGVVDASSSNKGMRLQLPSGMAAHQRARKICKMSNKMSLKVSGLLILLLHGNACDADTR